MELWSSRLPLLGSKQKRSQPSGRRHRQIRILWVDARKRRDPAGKAAHRAWTVRGSERCSRRVQIDHGSLRFIGAQLVQMSNVFQESGSRRSLGTSRCRRITGAASERRGVAAGGEGISAIGRKNVIGWSEPHWRCACVRYGCLRPVDNPPAQDPGRLGAGSSGRSPCLQWLRRLHRIQRAGAARQRCGPVGGAAGGVQLTGKNELRSRVADVEHGRWRRVAIRTAQISDRLDAVGDSCKSADVRGWRLLRRILGGAALGRRAPVFNVVAIARYVAPAEGAVVGATVVPERKDVGCGPTVFTGDNGLDASAWSGHRCVSFRSQVADGLARLPV
jgi:hypothetical protein